MQSPVPTGQQTDLPEQEAGTQKPTLEAAQVDPEKLERGAAQELQEHPEAGPDMARQIAADHLRENPAYYDRPEDAQSEDTKGTERSMFLMSRLSFAVIDVRTGKTVKTFDSEQDAERYLDTVGTRSHTIKRFKC